MKLFMLNYDNGVNIILFIYQYFDLIHDLN